MRFRARRWFSDDFKREAVALSLSSPQTLTDVAGKLGIHPGLLSRWRSEWIVAHQESDRPVPQPGPEKSVRELERENARLKKQLARAKLENDILKKAEEYVAKHRK